MPSTSAVDEDIEMSRRTLLKEPLREQSPPAKERGHARKGLRKPLIDGGCIILNIASTVVLVFLNKWHVFSL
jgi:hypothetical protein